MSQRVWTQLRFQDSAMMSRGLLLIVMLLAAALSPARIVRADNRPPILHDVSIDQNVNVQVPPGLVFRDEFGKEVRLGDYFNHGKPLILSLVYYKCPMLCTMVLNDLARSMNAMRHSAGDQFDILTVSFDPTETPELAYEKKQTYLQRYQRPHAADGWHFLTGAQDAIASLTRTVGFHYVWDPKFQQFAHASGIMILTPEGKVSRYFFGIDYAPTDLQLSLDEASHGKIATVTDQILLYCFHYDPSTGRYSLAIWRLVQTGGMLTLVILGGFMFVMFRRDRIAARQPARVPPAGWKNQ